MKKIARRVPPSVRTAAELRASAATTTIVSPILRPGLGLDPEPAPWTPVFIPVGVVH